jgi:hypothetical protein
MTMSDQPNSAGESVLSADSLKDLRENARRYLRLDLGYLAAAGAIVTALKFGRSEIIEVAAGVWFIGFAYILLILVDTSIEVLLLKEWIHTQIGSAKRMSAEKVMKALGWQPALHALFLSSIVVWGIGFSMGSTDALNAFRARVAIQDELDIFIAKVGRVPNSIEELRNGNDRIDSALRKLGEEPIWIEKGIGNKYKLIFSGDDRRFGTRDDEVVTPELPLREILKSRESRNKHSTQEGK